MKEGQNIKKSEKSLSVLSNCTAIFSVQLQIKKTILVTMTSDIIVKLVIYKLIGVENYM